MKKNKKSVKFSDNPEVIIIEKIDKKRKFSELYDKEPDILDSEEEDEKQQ